MSGLLDRAIVVAAQAHRGQVDKGGHPYILHPLRVMMAVYEVVPSNEDAQVAAVLHDVVEDTSTTLKMLRDLGFSKASVDAVDALTRRRGERYEEFVLRAKADPIARVVKMKDIEDNLDLSRLAVVSKEDMDRAEKYRRNLFVLQTD